MGNVAFTRDEAILALDTLYSAGGRRLRPDDEEIIELSRLLNELPVIHYLGEGKSSEIVVVYVTSLIHSTEHFLMEKKILMWAKYFI